MEEILSHRKDADGSLEFQVKWYGYNETTWEPRWNVPGELVSHYFTKQARRPRALTIIVDGCHDCTYDLTLQPKGRQDRTQERASLNIPRGAPRLVEKARMAHEGLEGIPENVAGSPTLAGGAAVPIVRERNSRVATTIAQHVQR